ncbi:DUF1622 domain-containing protein [Micromonospora olivasterospora]|uniref:Putative membrane protein n=1 Tax=Micromonospora olivasterospora TaxID=1880 RepID=A0A562IHT7_MICOL|nr:DUF1622 domain-containing protein [Micromonospora olivasterospora]TWH70154.1 putative membrane protein [Micromonospora olivasterospora]
MPTREFVERVGALLDLAGVLVIAVGVTVASAVFLYRCWRTRRVVDLYRPYRQGVGRAILLGLELLVGGDIIRTVAVAPSFRSVGVLALIVLVRTFLSFSLEVELQGRWPWQPRRAPADTGAARRPDGSAPRRL